MNAKLVSMCSLSFAMGVSAQPNSDSVAFTCGTVDTQTVQLQGDARGAKHLPYVISPGVRDNPHERGKKSTCPTWPNVSKSPTESDWKDNEGNVLPSPAYEHNKQLYRQAPHKDGVSPPKGWKLEKLLEEPGKNQWCLLSDPTECKYDTAEQACKADIANYAAKGKQLQWLTLQTAPLKTEPYYNATAREIWSQPISPPKYYSEDAQQSALAVCTEVGLTLKQIDASGRYATVSCQLPDKKINTYSLVLVLKYHCDGPGTLNGSLCMVDSPQCPIGYRLKAVGSNLCELEKPETRDQCAQTITINGKPTPSVETMIKRTGTAKPPREIQSKPGKRTSPGTKEACPYPGTASAIISTENTPLYKGDISEPIKIPSTEQPIDIKGLTRGCVPGTRQIYNIRYMEVWEIDPGIFSPNPQLFEGYTL